MTITTAVNRELLSLKVTTATTTTTTRTAKQQYLKSGSTTTLQVKQDFLYISLPSLHDLDARLHNFTYRLRRKHNTTILLLLFFLT